jgi:hypothetical protein
MALVDVIRGAVATVSGVVASLQEVVTHNAWIGQDGAGTDLFAASVTRRALVDRTHRTHEGASGVLVSVFATLTFIDPIAATTANAGQQRVNPVDPRDEFILQDGQTGPTIVGGGFDDAGKGIPFVNTVQLGG